MIKEKKKFNWRFLWWKIENYEIEKTKIDEILDTVAFLRARALSNIELLRARVDGEDLWFTCYPQKKENLKMEDKGK